MPETPWPILSMRTIHVLRKFTNKIRHFLVASMKRDMSFGRHSVVKLVPVGRRIRNISRGELERTPFLRRRWNRLHIPMGECSVSVSPELCEWIIWANCFRSNGGSGAWNKKQFSFLFKLIFYSNKNFHSFFFFCLLHIFYDLFRKNTI